MTFSRIHLGMLGVVSIFTGMISPVVKNATGGFPFPLTNIQMSAYVVLISLAIMCIFLAVRFWSGVRFFGLTILGLVGYLFMMAWNGEMRTNAGALAGSLSWGWIFLGIGCGLIIVSMFLQDIDPDDAPSLGDHIIGWFGALTILGLTGLIISISYVSSTERNDKNHIIEAVLGTGSVETYSGVVLSKAFPSIHALIFDRKQDSLSFWTNSGSTMMHIPTGTVSERLPYATTLINNIQYTVQSDGTVMIENGDIIGKAILPQDTGESVLMYSGNTLVSLSPNEIRSYSGIYNSIEDIHLSRIGYHFVWKSKTGTGYTIYRDSVAVGKQEYKINQIEISSDGSSIMALAYEADGSGYILKNGSKVEKLGKGYVLGSLRMNGNDSMYIVDQDGILGLVYNGTLMERKFDEIREIFLDINSDGYVYFGRPLGEKSYCLYTRYRGNLCGLTGYMNPRLSADGLSIIYAGLKDGAWGIYRNISPVIRNTGYPNRENISQDYAFFDITNPSYYLFIRHIDNGYQLYTKGRWIDGIWKDIGLDVTFGYDNKIIMSVQDIAGWHLIEF